MTVQDFPDWAHPQGIATAVSTTGVPLLRNTINLGNALATTVAGGTVVTLVPLTAINQPGYEFEVQIYMPAGQGTVPFVMVTMTWLDPTQALATGFRHFYLSCGNGAGNLLAYYITGPCRGAQVNIFVTNLDPSITASLQWSFNLTSHVYLTDRITQETFAATAPNGFGNPGGDPAAGQLALALPTVAANTTATRLCAVRNGKAILAVDLPQSGVPMVISLNDPAGIYLPATTVRMGTMRLTGPVTQSVEVALPNGPVNLSMINSSTTTAGIPNVSLTASDG